MTTNQVSRAQRFPLRLAMRYRQPNGSWLYGRTQNISASGLLFETDVADRMSNLGPLIEMDLFLPCATAVCLGRVVRTAPAMPEAPGVLAATITTYRLVSGHSRDPTAQERRKQTSTH